MKRRLAFFALILTSQLPMTDAWAAAVTTDQQRPHANSSPAPAPERPNPLPDREAGVPPGTAAQPPSETHRQAATELVALIDLEKGIMGGATAMVDAMIEQNPPLAPYRDVLLKWAGTFMNWETFGPRIVALYAESFTEPELRELIRFYKTPTGQKALALMPELTRRGAALGAEWPELIPMSLKR